MTSTDREVDVTTEGKQPAPTELVQFDRARLALAEAHSIDEVKAVRDQAEALRLYFRQADQGLEMQNHAAEIKMRAERRAGEMIEAMEKHPPGPDRLEPLTDLPPKLSDLGISRFQSHRWQRVASIPETDFEGYIGGILDDGGQELTTAGLLRRPDAPLRSSEAVEWYTPREYVEAARKVLGGIDLDPASSPQANKIVKAKTFYHRGDDAFGHEWKGRVFLNPPYGGASADFATKLVQSHQLGTVSAAVLLVNANSTDTAWFQPLWAYTLCFTNHRINFVSPDGEGSGSTHGSVFAYLGPEGRLFGEEFRRFGPIVQMIMEPLNA